LPIISSARAFRALWKRAYHKFSELMAAVVYEDPWLAGGHNGLSNAEDPTKPEDPYPRVKAVRDTMRAEGISDDVPIVMAGGVWNLKEWNHWIDNEELGQIAFQFGTRPLLTRESPIPEEWKARLMNLEEGDVLLHRFSPTGFYSSAVRNPFLRNLEARSHRQIAFQFGTRPLLTEESPIPQGWKDRLRELDEGDVLLHRFSPTGFYSSAVRNPFLRNLEARSDRQVPYSRVEAGEHTVQLDVGVKGKNFWVTPKDRERARGWVAAGHTEALKTPDDTVVFVTPEERATIREDQAACMGCLSHCGFSSWKDHDDHTTGRLADPRSFCIQKTLQDIAHGAPVDENLMFAGHAAYRFKQDPFYSNNFTPTVKQLVDRILTGD
jgi:NAD(P)H-dependent flavin oxidoreductase YrpB (nitropropane dioxygenase family)